MLRERRELVLQSSYRSFNLAAPLDSHVSWGAIPLNSLTETASGQLVIRTGSQFGPFHIEIETHSDEPASPVGDWEDVLEVSFRSDDPVSVFDLEIGAVAVLTSEPGIYRLRLSSRGRAQGVTFDDDEHPPGELSPEQYLLQAWSEREMREATILRGARADSKSDSSDGAEHDAPHLEFKAITHTLSQPDPMTVLSGELGTVHVEADVPGKQKQLFEYFSGPAFFENAWPSHGPFRDGVGMYMAAASPFGSEGVTGGRAFIGAEVAEWDPPRRCLLNWNWYLPQDPELPGQMVKGAAALATASTRETVITPLRHKPPPACRVEVIHREIPIEWVPELAAWWRSRLRIAQSWNLGSG